MSYLPFIIILYTFQAFIRTFLGYDSALSIIFVISLLFILILIKLQYKINFIDKLVIISLFLVGISSWIFGYFDIKIGFEIFRNYLVPTLTLSLLCDYIYKNPEKRKLFRKCFMLMIRLIYIWQLIEILSLNFAPGIADIMQSIKQDQTMASSRAIGIFGDLNTSIFILSLFLIIAFKKSMWIDIILVIPILYLSNIRTWFIASLVSILYINLKSMWSSLKKLRIRPLLSIGFTLTIGFVVFYTIMIIIPQFSDYNQSGRLIILYTTKYFASLISNHFHLFGYGPLDYAGSDNIPIEIQNNEIGWIYVIIELGIIPLIIIILSYVRSINKLLINNEKISMILFLYLFVGMLHHHTFVGNICCIFSIFSFANILSDPYVKGSNVSLISKFNI
tara:strand:- start:31498 stop:32670 length:1173 start_codon:yes stop_codon:yes gene_type:complete